MSLSDADSAVESIGERRSAVALEDRSARLNQDLSSKTTSEGILRAVRLNLKELKKGKSVLPNAFQSATERVSQFIDPSGV